MAVTERHYTHSVVTYASEEELQSLLSRAKHWAYVKHDKDTDKATHFHVLATFERMMSFKQVREMIVSTQNTFTEAVKGEISDVIAYFTHKGFNDKFQYAEGDVHYDSIEYWKRRVNQGEDEEDRNEAFMDDLLSPDFSVEKMGRKYGRDFIKNFRSYMDFRGYTLYMRQKEEAHKRADEALKDIDTSGMVSEQYFKLNSDGELIPVFEQYIKKG